MTAPASDGESTDDRAADGRRPLPLGDEDLLDILEEAIADERAAQDKYRRGLEGCADPADLRDVRAAAARGARPRESP